MTKAKSPNSRWRGGQTWARYSSERTVEHTRHVKNWKGQWRTVTDNPTELKFCERARNAVGVLLGWRNGARVHSLI